MPQYLSTDPNAGTPATPGLLVPGNIDLNNRPRVKNPDGSISTVRSLGVNIDGKEVLIPTVVGNRVVSDDEAIAQYKKTGQHLGMFDTPDHSTAYAQQLHESQAAQLAAPAPSSTDYLSTDPTAGAAPTFTASNQKDAQGNATVDPNTLGTYVRHLWNGVNPVAIGQLLPFPKALGGSGLDHPLNPVNIVKGLHAVKQEADAALDKGDYVTALAKYVESVIPVLGPIMSHQGNELVQGKYAAAAGDMTAMGVSAALPEALAGGTRVPVKPGLVNPNAAEAAAVQFGQARGIPIDAATATGNRFVRGVQTLADESMGGSVVGQRAKQAQAEGFARVADELATQAHPVATTPELAGQSVRDTLTTRVRDLNTEATTAYDTLRGIEAQKPIPVQLSGPKKALQPLYDRLKREAELVPLQGDKGRALVALDRLINGPDIAPLSTVDAALGDLKSMARADIPELRTQGQGLASAAVKQLDQTVQRAALNAGKPAHDALMQGRAATVAKYQAGDVLENIRAEPVQAYRQAVAPKDSGIAHLRSIASEAPAVVPQIARAYLEDLFGQATGEGGFNKAQKLQAEWQKLGPETKRTLFPAASQVQDLDQFFLLAKKAAESPNPSGTALTLWKGGELTALVTNPVAGVPYSLGATGLAKLLHSPTGVRALTRGLSLSIKGNQVSGAARAAAAADILTAARDAGVLDVPKAADQQPSGAQP